MILKVKRLHAGSFMFSLIPTFLRETDNLWNFHRDSFQKFCTISRSDKWNLNPKKLLYRLKSKHPQIIAVAALQSELLVTPFLMCALSLSSHPWINQIFREGQNRTGAKRGGEVKSQGCLKRRVFVCRCVRERDMREKVKQDQRSESKRGNRDRLKYKMNKKRMHAYINIFY